MPKPRALKDSSEYRKVLIHPEFFRQLAHEAIDEGITLQERIHAVLCTALDRPDLMPQSSDVLSSTN